MIKTTPNLALEFHPVPKPLPKAKTKTLTVIKPGIKTKNWVDAREQLKEQFAVWGITTCEVGKLLELRGIKICVKNNFLGFAHTRRRGKLTLLEVREAEHVVLACQPCHQFVDLQMDRTDSEAFLKGIVAGRKYSK